MKRRPSVLSGLADGAKRIGAPDLGRAIGESLENLRGWPAGGILLVPQTCPIEGCGYGPYSSVRAFNRHLQVHEGLGPRARSELCDLARHNSMKAAMNGARSP